MLRLPVMLLFAFLVACGRGGILQSGTPQVPQSTGNWFCQPAAGGEAWDCVQDEALARSPQPATASSPMAPGTVAGDGPDTAPTSPAATEKPILQEPEPQAGAEHSRADEPPADDLARQPAVRPETDTDPLLAMPDDYFAVQLVALDSADELDAFVATHGLGHLPHARVERDGQIHHVLLLGVYESYALAEAASLDPPPPLKPGDSWIRPLGGLKRAMQRATSLEAG